MWNNCYSTANKFAIIVKNNKNKEMERTGSHSEV